jgi:hypothetical protein
MGKYPGRRDTRTLGKNTRGGDRLLVWALTEPLHPIARNAAFDESLVSAKGRADREIPDPTSKRSFIKT